MKTQVVLDLKENKETGEWVAIATLPKEGIDEARKRYGRELNDNDVYEMVLNSYIAGFFTVQKDKESCLKHILECIQKCLIVGHQIFNKQFDKGH